MTRDEMLATAGDAAGELERVKAENDRLLGESAHTIRLAQDIEAKWPRMRDEMQAELDRLRADNAALVAVLRPCMAILRFKEIRPPMYPGVQEEMEQNIAAALAAHAAPTVAVVHYAPYGKNKLGQFDCGASDGGYTTHPANVTCEGCKDVFPGLWPHAAK